MAVKSSSPIISISISISSVWIRLAPKDLTHFLLWALSSTARDDVCTVDWSEECGQQQMAELMVPGLQVWCVG